MTEDRRFTQPLYTVAAAARLVGMPPSTLASWANGYQHRFPGRATVAKGPVITAVDATHRSAALNASATLGFLFPLGIGAGLLRDRIGVGALDVARSAASL